jgi:sugar lactone lactonase YvrE
MSIQNRIAAMGASAALALVSGCGDKEACPNPGDICTVAGTGTSGFTGDGSSALEADLYFPMDVAVGPDKLLYIVDWNNHRLRRVDANGKMETIAGSGELGDSIGIELESSFNHPTNLTFDPQGRVLIAAWHNSRIKRIDPATKVVENICGTGKRWYSGDDGPAMTADLDLPSSVAIGEDGSIFVMDQANQMIRRIDSTGTIHRFAGQCIVGVPADENDKPQPCPVAEGKPANGKLVYGLDKDPAACTEYRVCGRSFGGDNGPALEARLGQPVGQAAAPAGRLVFDKAGNLLFADTSNNRIRKIDRNGIITTIAGSGERGYGGDGGAATAAKLNTPVDVEIGPEGDIYFTDTGNSCVRAINAEGIVRTAVGTCGKPGEAGDGAPAAKALLDSPYGIAFDHDGNMFIADTQNSRIRKVRKQ